MFTPDNKKEIKQVHIWKHNLERKHQIVLVMITEGEKWHYLDVMKIYYNNELHQQIKATTIIWVMSNHSEQ